MAKTTVVKMRRRAPAASLAALGPGIHPAKIDVCAGDRYRVRTLAGERLEARLGDGVEVGFAAECLREQRTVLVTPGEDGQAVILGALQTSRALLRNDAGSVKARGKHVELEADEGLTLRVGKSALVMDRHGVIKVTGQRMTMNIAEVARILSALCELP
jgi:hypothetical protein